MNPVFVEQLRESLADNLPGLPAQLRMASPVRAKIQVGKQPEQKDVAAVMALLYPYKSEPHIVYIKRSGVSDVRHGGQLGFPGGRVEAEDRGLGDTALRETEEEIGVDREQVQIIGELSSLYIPVSNYLVHPFVGVCDERPEFRPEPGEVETVIETSLAHLLDESTCALTEIELLDGRRLDKVPHYSLGEHQLWGATAMMTSELLEVVRSISSS